MYIAIMENYADRQGERSVVRRLLFPFLFAVVEKRVWWISIGRFVQQTPRFWKSLIGVDNYKGFFDKVIVICNYVIK